MNRTKHKRKRTKFKRRRTKQAPTFQTNLKKIELLLGRMQIANRHRNKKEWKQLDKQLYKAQILELKNRNYDKIY